MLTYREALQAILNRSDYERNRGMPYARRDWRLARVEELLDQLGAPQRAYPTVHIAGTKGKGSVTAMVDAMLRAAGYRTGMYTSPHLHTFRERIRLQGDPISETSLVELVEALLPALESRPHVSVFEAITALAMWHFARSGVDIGVFEVGMGGRLDATNVILPLVSLITSVSLDHIGVLGSTLAQIAGEKAGIIKPGVPVVSAPQRAAALRVVRETAARLDAPLTLVGSDWRWRALGACEGGQRLSIYRRGSARRPDYPDLFLPLLGAFQLENACTAVAGMEVLRQQGLRVEPEAIHTGLAQVRWPGRLQVLSREPLVVVDGAHNPYSAGQLLKTLPAYLDYQRIVLIFGSGRTHRPSELLDVLLPAADRTFVARADHPKAAPAELLYNLALASGHEVTVCSSPLDALRQAVSGTQSGDLILATGSLFLVAEVMSAWATLRGLEPYPSDPPGAYTV
jgi:dihydrofolate synthase/folylpolyglutamate synthase